MPACPPDSLRPVSLLAVAALAALAACSPSERQPAAFALARTSPALGAAAADAAPLLLNDAVTAYFTAPVMPVSVTPDSFTVVDDRGLRVPGELRVGADWVSFVPTPPVAAALDDGSFRPASAYELRIAGMPRPDAVRSLDGARLAAPVALSFRTAARDAAPPGLPAPLRPPASELPFVLRPTEGVLQLPADAPRVRLDFTQPILPESATPAAFEITLLDRPPFESLTPRSVRVVPPRRDGRRSEEVDGAVVEIDLGATGLRRGGESRPLRAGDRVCVQVRSGPGGLRDYRGIHPLAAPPQLWTVVAGDQLPLAEWPLPTDALTAADGVSPTFEARGGALRPRVRRECGDGRLGVFQPRRDTVLRPGAPFDRGDGAMVVSDGPRFPFLAIDIPAGVTVRVEADRERVQLLAVGSVRIGGTLLAAAMPAPPPERRFQSQPALELAAAAPVALLAGGDIELAGQLAAEPPPHAGTTSWTLASAGVIDLRAMRGALPFQTVLAVDAAAEGAQSTVLGVRGQSLVHAAQFQYGLPPGASVRVEAVLPWRAMPADRSAGVLRAADVGGVAIAWQAAPADPVRRGLPDTSPGRVGRQQPAHDGDVMTFQPGDFVRCVLTCQAAAGDLPAAAHVRIVAR